jgi:hypothetical protein
MQTVTSGATGLVVTPIAYGNPAVQGDLAEIGNIMAAAIPVGGPTPEGMP